METVPAHAAALPRPRDAWYVLADAAALGRRPRAVCLFGVPLVLFRDGAGSARALLDRCAHRNLPLSAGRVRRGTLQCAYHGWCFDGAGHCRAIPASTRPIPAEGCQVPAYPACESQGLIWIYARAGAIPATPPPVLPWVGASDRVHVRARSRFAASLCATAENILDVPHTAFLHGGLFRSARRPQRLRVQVQRGPDWAAATFLGEAAPTGLLARLLAPAGGVVQHTDRFALPCIAQVDYSLGSNALSINNLLTPVSDFVTEVTSIVSLRLPFGAARLLQPLIEPLARRVVAQDQRVLRLQSEAIRRFGGEQYASTEVDVLGRHILALLRQAEAGTAPPAADRLPAPTQVRMRV